ncbi:hypothetical protein BG015_004133 [Linnemannia schmuckeri]|uniref:Uncharacterized protein n=1 Tax=Linnemannia schmuckeri TaxID=64567 RepID=A0A9P5RGA9_9FUNG|nr:hypothetical protein BG015_004133 [Linnemannia schmuckeri]
MKKIPKEHDLLRGLAAQVATELLKWHHKSMASVTEIMLLDPVLERKDDRSVFHLRLAGLQYVGGDESPLHMILRFGIGVTKSALGVASIF